MRGYDAWKLSGPPESYDERSECEQAGCDRDGHAPGCPDYVDHDDWPVHQPEAHDAPIPGRHWYAGCEPGGDPDGETGLYHGTGPRVDPATGICEGCGEVACRECGRENCPDHDRQPVAP